jgi:ribosomal protein S18 acetylase RimI-like enzyme
LAASTIMNRPAVSIHVVSQDNASLLDSVDDDVFDGVVQPHLTRAFLSNPANHLVVAVAEGRVVGMASGVSYVHPDKPLALFINEVGVAGRFHRQGIGRQLVTRLLETGRQLGCTEAWVATEFGNLSARALYESLGGVPDEEHAVVYVYALQDQSAPAPEDGDA